MNTAESRRVEWSQSYRISESLMIRRTKFTVEDDESDAPSPDAHLAMVAMPKIEVPQRKTAVKITRRRSPARTVSPMLLSRESVAYALGISLRSVTYLIAHGKIKAKKLGGRTMITTEELARFVRIGGHHGPVNPKS